MRTITAATSSRSSSQTGVSHNPRHATTHARPRIDVSEVNGEMSIEGKWRITKMDLWDQEAIDLLGPAFIELKSRGGQFRFIAVEGRMDCRYGQRNGRPSIDFTWEGNDECDPASGRGWVTLQQNGSLTGHIYFHHGDDSGFKATPVDLDDKATRKARPTTTRGSR